MKQIGESCDWSREKFTLSPELSRVVREVFVRLYEEGLIIGEKRTELVPVCLTVLSDLEVVHEERQGHLGTSPIRWRVRTRNQGYDAAGDDVADTAVAAHPGRRALQALDWQEGLAAANEPRNSRLLAMRMVDR